jgi:stearoyl-CoA desaturase (delta-9 desaturase)
MTTTAAPSIRLARRFHVGWTIVLFSSIVIGALTAIPIYAYFYDYTALHWWMFGALYLVSGLGITVGYHRLMSHRSFDCPDWVKAGLLIAGAWALQNSAIKWTADHLQHHAHCDEEADPYNAKLGFWHSHCGWLFSERKHDDIQYVSRVAQDPVALWQHRHYTAIVLVGLALTFAVGFVENGLIGGLGCFLLAGVGRTFAVLNSTFCINSVCHIWGNQPFSSKDSSRDSWWVSLITFGEGYHNYHHTFPSDYRNGARWYDFDPSKWLIYTLYLLGLASGLRTASHAAADRSSRA